LTVADADRLRAIRLRSLRDAPEAFSATFAESAARSTEAWQRQLRELATFIAVADGQDVGVVRGGPHDRFPDAAHLLSLWVAPEARRQGIGLALVDAVIEWARSEGRRRLFIDVFAQNEPAIAVYRRARFVPNEVGAPPGSSRNDREIQLVLAL
jgi:GNAT superfamily N-acetyltransferase